MARLEITRGLAAGKSYEINQRETLLGRHPECQVQLRETTISRRHARIVQQQDGFYVEDLGSQHGTLVNGRRLTNPVKLNDGDEIHISESCIAFHHTDIHDEPFAPQDDSDRPSSILSSVDAISRVRSINEANAQLKLRALLEIVHSLGVSLEIKEIFPKLLDGIFRIFPQANRGYILVGEENNPMRLHVRAAKQLSDSERPRPMISQTIAKLVMSEGKAILSGDAGEDERFRSSDSIGNFEIRSVMCVPLINTSGQAVGMIHLDSRDPLREQFTTDDLDVLVNIATLAGKQVEHARLHETQLQFDRRERDLATARQVQLHFLPQERPSVPGYELADYYRAADAVGGDYFGYIELPDGRLAIAMADVAGKGVPAALLMARLCSEAKFCLVTTRTPAAAVMALNRQVFKIAEFGQFITFAVCVLEPATHELVVVNAGHMNPFLRRKDGVLVAGNDKKGPPVGIIPDQQYDQAVYPIEPGDTLLMYTDGVNEAIGAKDEQFGNERVKQVAAQPLAAEALIKTLIQDLEKFAQGRPQFDDICVVAISRKQEE